MKANTTTIRVHMARRSLTGTILSEMAGISRQTLSMVLHGKDCTPATIGKIAKALNTDPEEILKEDHTP